MRTSSISARGLILDSDADHCRHVVNNSLQSVATLELQETMTADQCIVWIRGQRCKNLKAGGDRSSANVYAGVRLSICLPVCLSVPLFV